MSTEEMTRADRGVAIYEALTALYNEALKGKDSQTVLQLKAQYEEAVLHLIEATGARFTMPNVLNSITTDDRAVMLAQAVRRAHQFMTTNLRTAAYDILLTRSQARLRNSVDFAEYDHLATVTTDDGRVFYFAVNAHGQHVLSEKMYWEPIIK